MPKPTEMPKLSRERERPNSEARTDRSEPSRFVLGRSRSRLSFDGFYRRAMLLLLSKWHWVRGASERACAPRLRGAICGLLIALLAHPLFPQITTELPAPPVPPPGVQVQPGASGIASFSTTTSQVIVNVTVTGRDGKPVTNLTKDDFLVYEDGKLQTLLACQFEQ